MKKITLILLIFISLNVYSQNQIDAFRFSESFYAGTARSMSMAGAFGAFGSDLSVALQIRLGLVFSKVQIFLFHLLLYLIQQMPLIMEQKPEMIT
jgi:hypothetical protein